MRSTAIVSFAFVCAFAALGACSGESSEQGDGGGEPTGGAAGSSSGAAGTAGRGGSGTSGASGSGGAMSSGGTATGGTTSGGGVAGTAPTGGVAGTAPTGGDAGTAPTGGVGGSAGGGTGGGGGRECETADDCVMFTDCCSCEAVPKGTSHPSCALVCITDHCSSLQIRPEEVSCSFGRCVIDRSCNHAQATCNSLPEPCPAGEVRSLNDNQCWGPCLPATECREVTDCADCGDAVCVSVEPQIRSVGCVVPDDTCTKGSYCECLGACPTGGFVCMEADDAVHCPCPVC